MSKYLMKSLIQFFKRRFGRKKEEAISEKLSEVLKEDKVIFCMPETVKDKFDKSVDLTDFLNKISHE